MSLVRNTVCDLFMFKSFSRLKQTKSNIYMFRIYQSNRFNLLLVFLKCARQGIMLASSSDISFESNDDVFKFSIFLVFSMLLFKSSLTYSSLFLLLLFSLFVLLFSCVDGWFSCVLSTTFGVYIVDLKYK